jgi:glycosyltransferase involved in cell wall biosynthesis
MLRRAGHQVITFCRSNWEADDYVGIRQITLATWTIWNSKTRKDFLKLLRQEKPDVVHVHNTFVIISPSIYSACFEERIPVVQTLHNYRLLCPGATFFRDGKVCEECLPGPLWPSVRHSCYGNSRTATAVVAGRLAYHRVRGTWNDEISCFIAPTEFARQKFIQGTLPAERIFVKPHFVHPDPGRHTGNRDYALFAGRLSPGRRVSIVLEAWKRGRFSVPLLIIGGGSNQRELERQAAADGHNQIQFLGQLSHDATMAAVRKARFLVFSSEWYENFGLTMVEAFACCTPVIASDIGTMKEIVEDGRSGLHFSVGNPDSLAQKVEWALSHPNQMCAMGMEARRVYETKYTADKNYPLLMEIYERAMKHLPATARPNDRDDWASGCETTRD